MEAVLEKEFSLSYRSEALSILLSLYSPSLLHSQSPHFHSLVRLLVTLGDPNFALPALMSLVTTEVPLAYQLAFDIVAGGSKTFLKKLRRILPVGQEVCSRLYVMSTIHQSYIERN